MNWDWSGAVYLWPRHGARTHTFSARHPPHRPASLLVPTNARIAFCYSVGGVPAEQFIHEKRLEPTRAPTMDGTDGSPQTGGRDRAQSVLAQIALTISVSNRRRLVSGFTSHRVVSSWERPARIDRITLIEARYLWARISASPSGSRNMDRTGVGIEYRGKCWPGHAVFAGLTRGSAKSLHRGRRIRRWVVPREPPVQRRDPLPFLGVGPGLAGPLHHLNLVRGVGGTSY